MRKNLFFTGLLFFASILQMAAQITTPITVKANDNQLVEFDGNSHTLTGYTVTGMLLPNDEIVSVTMDASYIAPGTYSITPSSVVIVNSITHVESTSKYDITKLAGTLVINHRTDKYLITPVPNSQNFTYDGLAHEASGFVTNTFDIVGHNYTLSGLTAYVSETNAGVYPVVVTGTPIVKLGELDVSSEFTVAPVSTSKLTINRRALPIAVARLDASAHTYANDLFVVGYGDLVEGSDYESGATGLVAGDYFTAGSMRTSEKTVGTYILNEGTVLVTEDFETHNGIGNYLLALSAEMEIAKRPVRDTVRGTQHVSVYNGLDHECTGYTLHSSDPLYLQEYVVKPDHVTISRMLAGTTLMGLRPSLFQNTNENFEVTFVIEDGSVTVTPAGPLTIASCDSTKKYDGLPLTQPRYTLTGSLVEGDVLTVEVGGTTTHSGRVRNQIDGYRIMRSSLDVTDCYTINPLVEGNLIVEPRILYVTTADSMKMYDGIPLTAPRYTLTGEGFVGTENITFDFSGAQQTTPGESFNIYTPNYSSETYSGDYVLVNTLGKLSVVDSFKLDLWQFAILCYGDPSGSISIYGQNGRMPYQYKISGGSYDGSDWQTMTGGSKYIGTGLAVGHTYQIVARDAYGVYDTAYYTPHYPAKLQVSSVDVQGANCGASDGSIALNVTGGTPIDDQYYFYTWSTGSHAKLLTELPVGNYSVTVTDYLGCRVVQDVTVPLANPLAIQNIHSRQTCSTTFSRTYTPVNSNLSAIPLGTTYSWGAPEITPASAAAYVTGTSTGTNQPNVFSGNLVNNSGVQVRVVYTVTASTAICLDSDVFTITIDINGENLDVSPMTITHDNMEICHSVTDTILTVHLSGLDEMDSYPTRWSFGGVVHNHLLPRGATEDTIHISWEHITGGIKYYDFEITDLHSCIHIGNSSFKISSGSWSVPASPAVHEVQCVEDAVEPTAIAPIVVSSCGDTIPRVHSSYAVGDHCDMNIYHVYTYTFRNNNLPDSTVLWIYNYHVKDNTAPTVRVDYPHQVRAISENCVFYVPDLKDSIAPFADNCVQPFIMGFEQIPASGEVITRDTVVKLIVTDYCENKDTTLIRVYVDQPLAITATAWDSHCYNMRDGYIEGSFSGGIPPYSLLWERGIENGGILKSAAGSYRFDDLSDGNYKVYVLSGNGCVSRDTVSLTISDREEMLEVTASSASKTYDGTPLTSDSYSITHGSLVEGDELFVTVSGSRTDKGVSPNIITDLVVKRGGVDVTCEYNYSKVSGTLTVNPRAINITSGSATKVYDGTPLTDDHISYSSAFVGSDTVNCTITGSRIYAGTSENDFTYTFVGGNAENYQFTQSYGLLKVTKITTPIVITAKDSTKVYDGDTLTQPGYYYTSGVLQPGDVLTAITSGKQVDVGTNYNVITSFVIKRGLQDVTNCYTISPRRLGVLRVTARALEIQVGSYEVQYDGDLHTWADIPEPQYTLIGGTSLATTDHFASTPNPLPIIGSGILPGYHPTSVDLASLSIKNSLNEDKTGNYNVIVHSGNIRIKDHTPPYSITLIAHSDTVDYDGSYKVCQGYDTVVVNGVKYPWHGSTSLSNITLVNEYGHSHTYTIHGLTAYTSQRNARDYYSVFITGTPTITDDGGHNVSGQFSITRVSGKFVINKLGALVVTINDTKRYDSNPLTTPYTSHTTVTGLGSADQMTGGAMTTNSPAIGTYVYNEEPALSGATITAPYTTEGGISNYNGVVYNTTQNIIIGNTMTVACPSGSNATKVYDGTPLAPVPVVTAPVHDATSPIILYSIDGGATYDYTVPSITDVGTQNVTVKVRYPDHYEDVDCDYTLTVTRRPVTFTSATAQKEYDGTDLTAPTVTVTGSGFATDEGFETYSVNGHVRNVIEGIVPNPLTYVLKSNTKATNYTFDTIIGTLKITPRPVTITSADSTSNFSPGEYLVSHKAKVTSAKGFLGGDTVTYTFTGKQLEPGRSNNTFSIAGFIHGTDATSTLENYNITRLYGELKVLETMEVEMSSQHDSVMYDGITHTGTKFTVRLNGTKLDTVPGSHGLKFYIYAHDNILTIIPTASIINVGHVQSTFNYDVTYGSLDITTCYPYYVFKDTGNVYVTPRPVTITVNDDKVYDNAQLANNYSQSSKVVATGLATGDKMSAGVMTTNEDSVHLYHYNDVVDGLSSSATTPFVIRNGNGTGSDVTTNYLITYVANQRITRSNHYDLYCPGTANNSQIVTKIYDGAELNPTAVVANQYSGDVFKIEYKYGSTDWTTTQPTITHVAESPLAVQVRASHHDYDTTYCSYTLTINKRPVKLISATDEKVYDKTPLTNDGVTVSTASGFYQWVAGEVASYSVTGSQTDVGSSKNNFTYTHNAAAQATDYVVTLDSGLLTVTKSPNLVAECPGTTENPAAVTQTYDGTDLTPSAQTSGLYAGDVATVEYSTDNGSSWNTTVPAIRHYVDGPQTVKVRATHPNYTTANCQYTLTINKRPVTVTSESDTKVYDATPLRRQVANVTSGSIVSGESFVYGSFASRTHFGDSLNLFNFNAGPSTDIRDYDTTKVYGHLVITASNLAEINCPGTAGNTQSITKTYDGTPLAPTAIATGIGSESVPVQYSTDNVNWVSAQPSITHTGTLRVYVRTNSLDYVQKDCNYLLTINQRPLTITATDSKVYNHTKLANNYSQTDKVVPTGLATSDKLMAGVITTNQDSVHVYHYNSVMDGKSSSVTTPFVIKNENGTGIDVTTDYEISYVANQSITRSNHYDLYCPGTANNSQIITKIYDGAELNPTAVVANQYSGDVFKIEYKYGSTDWTTTQPTITHVAESPLAVQVRASHHDYDTTYCSYTLTINKRPVKLISATDEKVYDKTPLTNDGVTVTTASGFYQWVAGEVASYSVTGSQTDVGSSKNNFSYTHNAAAQATDYVVTLDSGLLTVTKSPNLVAECPGTAENPEAVTKTYDGTDLTPSAQTSGLYADDVATVEYSTDNGSSWSTTVPAIRHYADGPQTVKVRATHPNYTTANCQYTLTIAKRPVTLTSESDTKVYDATPLTREAVTVTSGSIVSGESFVYSNFASRTHVGDSQNTFNYAEGSSTDLRDYNVTQVYGHLVVTPSALAVVNCPGTAENTQVITKMYDGTALAPTATATGIGGVFVPVQYSVDEVAWQNTPIAITHTGTQRVYVRTNNSDYTVATCNYLLTINCRNITLTSQDSTRRYNGSSLVATRVTVGGDGFVAGESFTYDNFATITHVGTTSNTFHYAAATGTTLTDYCVATPTYGTLTVTPSNLIALTCPSGTALSKLYDGTELHPAATATGIGADVIKVEYSLTGTSGWSTTPLGITNAGTQRVYVRASHSDYDTVTCDYNLEIYKRNVTLTSATGSREYNGTPFTISTVTVTGGDGFVTGEGFTPTVTGSQTEVGTSSNTFTYELNPGTLAINYNVTLVSGSLTVYKSNDLVLTCPSGTEISKMYDGTALQPSASVSGAFGSDVIKIEYKSGSEPWSETVESITHVGSKHVFVRASNPNYDTVYCDYTLTVNCRNITLTSRSDVRVYNAASWKYEFVDVTGDGLVAGEEIAYSNFPSILNVGQISNTFDYAFTAPALAADYCVTVVNGTLKVVKAPITLECPSAASATKVYDGTPIHPVAVASGIVASDIIKVEYSINGGTTWSLAEPAIVNVGTQPVDVRASNTNFDTATCSYTLTITPITDPIELYVVGHHQLFNWDGNPHTVYGFDTTCANTYYRAVMDTSFSFTGPASITRTDIGTSPMGLEVSQFSNHNPNFTNVTFHVTDGWIDIKDVIKPEFVYGCSDIGDKLVLPNTVGNRYTHSGTAWNTTATDNIAVTSLKYTVSGATTTHNTAAADFESLDGQIFELGVTVVTWTAKDAADNDTTCTFSVKVEDNTPPEVTCPGDTLVMCSGLVPAAATTYAEFVAIGGSATDNVGIVESTFTLKSEVSDGLSCPEKITRTYAIKDAVGNEGTCAQVITVNDTVKPTFMLPADLTICRNATTGDIEAPVAATGTISGLADNCTAVADLVSSWRDVDTTGNDAEDRIIHREWKVVDECGNATTKVQNITVRPSILTPGNITITCPNDTSVELRYGRCDTIVVLNPPVIVNSMSGMSVAISHDGPADNRYIVDTVVVTWTIIDECGAKLYCHQEVAVRYPPCGTTADSVADIDGNRYSSVRIGCNCWTGENARSIHYPPYTRGPLDEIDGKYKYEDSDSLLMIYGYLYTWYSAVDVPEDDDSALPLYNAYGRVQGICPTGWALPTQEEFIEMVYHSGGTEHTKHPSTLYWHPGLEGIAPFSGFKSLGSGLYRAGMPAFESLMSASNYWTVTTDPGSPTIAIMVELSSCTSEECLLRAKKMGASVRCVRIW